MLSASNMEKTSQSEHMIMVSLDQFSLGPVPGFSLLLFITLYWVFYYMMKSCGVLAEPYCTSLEAFERSFKFIHQLFIKTSCERFLW
jgi:hypothetical protein